MDTKSNPGTDMARCLMEVLSKRKAPSFKAKKLFGIVMMLLMCDVIVVSE